MCAFDFLLRRIRMRRCWCCRLSSHRIFPIFDFSNWGILLRRFRCMRSLTLAPRTQAKTSRRHRRCLCAWRQHMQMPNDDGAKSTRMEWRIVENHVDLCVSANRIFRTPRVNHWRASVAYDTPNSSYTNILNWLGFVCVSALPLTSQSFIRCLSLLVWIHLLFIYTFTHNDSVGSAKRLS